MGLYALATLLSLSSVFECCITPLFQLLIFGNSFLSSVTFSNVRSFNVDFPTIRHTRWSVSSLAFRSACIYVKEIGLGAYRSEKPETMRILVGTVHPSLHSSINLMNTGC